MHFACRARYSALVGSACSVRLVRWPQVSSSWVPKIALPYATNSRSIDQRFGLRPLARRVYANLVPILRKAAVHTDDQVLLADHAGEVLDPPGDEFRMLDHVSRLGDQAWNKDLAVRQFDVAPDHPLV